MPVPIDFRARRAEIGALSRVIEDESDRICAVIDTSRDFRERESALLELRQLAQNIRVCLQALESPAAEHEHAYRNAA